MRGETRSEVRRTVEALTPSLARVTQPGGGSYFYYYSNYYYDNNNNN